MQAAGQKAPAGEGSSLRPTYPPRPVDLPPRAVRRVGLTDQAPDPPASDAGGRRVRPLGESF
eukprot:5689696-Prymnesium_polylepis.1